MYYLRLINLVMMLEDEAGYVLLKQQNLKSVDPANF